MAAQMTIYYKWGPDNSGLNLSAALSWCTNYKTVEFEGASDGENTIMNPSHLNGDVDAFISKAYARPKEGAVSTSGQSLVVSVSLASLRISSESISDRRSSRL